VIIFISVRFLLKKITKPNFFKKKTKQNRNWFKLTDKFQFSSVQFGYFIFKTKNYIIFWVFFVISKGFGCGLTRFFFNLVVLLILVWFSLVFFILGLWIQNRTSQYQNRFGSVSKYFLKILTILFNNKAKNKWKHITNRNQSNKD
jgi:hypothetical protein